MIKAILLIFEPGTTWERIFLAQRSLLFVLFAFLLPLLVLTSAGEGYGLIHWGKMQGEVPHPIKYSLLRAVSFEAAQMLLTLFVVFVCAKMLKAMQETFNGQHTFSVAFSTIAYGLSPLFMLRLMDTFTGISPWVAWSIGITLSISVIYHGVPKMLLPDPPHAFGLFISTALMMALTTGILRFVTAAYLMGKFPRIHELFPS